jgi:hypothetical protein
VESLWPQCGPALSAIVVAVPLTFLLGGVLGLQVTLLNLAALATMQLGVAWGGGQGETIPEWDAWMALVLPWQAGHLLFGSPTLSSWALALLFGLTYASVWRVRSAGGRVITTLAQLLVGAWLVALHRPLPAVMVVLFLVPQMSLLPWLREGQSPAWYARHARLWILAAMLVAAWAL